MTCAVAGIGRTTYSRNSGRTTRGMAVAACRDAIADAGLAEGVNVYGGKITYKAVADSQGQEYTALDKLL